MGCFPRSAGRSRVGSAEPDRLLPLQGGAGPDRGSRLLPAPGVQGARSARFLWFLIERFVVANSHPASSPAAWTRCPRQRAVSQALPWCLLPSSFPSEGPF